MSTSRNPPSPSSSTDACEQKERYINPVARVLLAAVLLPSRKSPFSILATCPDIIEVIYRHLRHAWRAAITPGYDDVTIDRFGNRTNHTAQPSPAEFSRVALCRLEVHYFEFPRPTGLFCNMLPFISDDFSTIPEEYHGYLNFIRACQGYVTQPGRVWYLTIHESEISARGPQRRPGIHVEGFLASPTKSIAVPWWHHWGMGLGGASFAGGVFQVSNTDDSTRMWNAQIPREPSAALGLGCDVEHLRGVLDEMVDPVYPRANELFWLTDATPHESLPVEKGTYRQYFRLVTSEVSAWWELHSTKNRLGIQPGCTILKHNKFGKDAYLGLRDDSGDEEEEISPLN